MNERAYDNAMNEGGEGYNPIRSKREREEWESAQAAAKARLLTPQGKIEALHRRIEIECGSVAREWDSEGVDALRRDLRAQIDIIQAKIDAEFLAEWTAEVTQARRADWNARVKAGEFGKIGSKRVDFKAVTLREKAQGWTLDQLKRAIALHK